jgi:hypothetical protein
MSHDLGLMISMKLFEVWKNAITSWQIAIASLMAFKLM